LNKFFPSKFLAHSESRKSATTTDCATPLLLHFHVVPFSAAAVFESYFAKTPGKKINEK